MSAALQSLMRQPAAPRAAGGGILSFLFIGGGAALGFVVVSSTSIGLLPMVEPWLVSAACYGAFILPVYLLHRRYSFRSEAAHRRALPRYLLVQAMALLLASLFGYVFHGMLALPSLPAALLVIALTSGVNYLVLRGWAFAFKRPQELAAA